MSEPRDLATPPTLADALLSGRPNEAVRPLARFRPPFTEDAVKARGGARMAGRRAATRKARALDLAGQTARGDLAEALRGLEQALREEPAARQDERVRRVTDDLVDSLTGRASAKPEARMSEALEALLKVSQTEVERQALRDRLSDERERRLDARERKRWRWTVGLGVLAIVGGPSLAEAAVWLARALS